MVLSSASQTIKTEGTPKIINFVFIYQPINLLRLEDFNNVGYEKNVFALHFH